MGTTALHPAFILFSRPFQDNSVIVDVFSPAIGRFGVVARNVRATGRNQQRRALFQPFVPIMLSWQGRGELKSLLQIEADGVAFHLQGERLFSGLYVNELLMRLLHRYDPHPNLYQHYIDALQGLAGDETLEWVLRRFELQLLNELGYGVDLQCDGNTGQPLIADTYYRLTLDEGFLRVDADVLIGNIPTDNVRKDVFRGADLLALAANEQSEILRPVAKRLCRLLLAPQLGDKPLQSRELMKGLSASSLPTSQN